MPDKAWSCNTQLVAIVGATRTLEVSSDKSYLWNFSMFRITSLAHQGMSVWGTWAVSDEGEQGNPVTSIDGAEGWVVMKVSVKIGELGTFRVGVSKWGGVM